GARSRAQGRRRSGARGRGHPTRRPQGGRRGPRKGTRRRAEGEARCALPIAQEATKGPALPASDRRLIAPLYRPTIKRVRVRRTGPPKRLAILGFPQADVRQILSSGFFARAESAPNQVRGGRCARTALIKP